jgi:antirestriction protein ArdC
VSEPIHDLVTERMIAALERGTTPGTKPGVPTPGSVGP